jgi:methylthioribulose-1-phosphate dehydratase
VVEAAREPRLLAREIEAVLRHHPRAHGVLVRRHGLYAWGADLDEARRHVEALEFLFEVVGRLGPEARSRG